MIPARLMAVGAICACAAWSAYAVTNGVWTAKYESLRRELAEAVAESGRLALEAERAQRQLSDQIQARIAAESRARQVKAQTIVKEVVRYVESNNSSDCELDDDWLRISAASTPVPRAADSSSLIIGAHSGVRSLSRALEVQAHNYSVCQDAVDRLSAWQDWYRESQDSMARRTPIP